MVDDPNGTGYPNLPGITEADFQQMLQSISNLNSLYSGQGGKGYTFQNLIGNFDRFNINPTLPDHNVEGLTFITRPKLNLHTSNIRQDGILATLDTDIPDSFPFAIRCMLDSKLAKYAKSDHVARADSSRLFDNRSPFINALSNSLVSIQGFPDIYLDTSTSEGGFMGEDQTIAIGSDRGNKTYELSLTFKEIQGGFNMALFYYWIWWIIQARLGIVIAYPEDIEARRLCYTCSIYRFVLDPSRQIITRWAKATGCFPRSVPIGSVFNINEREHFLSSATQFTIPFVANHVEYNKPIIFRDFNLLMKKYAGQNYHQEGQLVGALQEYNFRGLPYIDEFGGFNEMQFIASPSELTDIEAYKSEIGDIDKIISNAYGQLDDTVNPNDNNPNSFTVKPNSEFWI